MDKGNDDRGIYRAIYTNLWDDPDFRSLSPEAKLVFINIRTSPHSNMPCIYPYYVEAIQKHTGLPTNVIEKALDTLCDTHWIVIQDGMVWVRNGLKYDPNISLSNSLHLKAIKRILRGLPKSKLVVDFCTYYGIDLPYTIPNREGMVYPMPITDPEPEPYRETEKDRERETEHDAFLSKPYQEIVDLFNKSCPRLPKVSELSQSRKESIKARLREHPNLSWWEKVFEKANNSAIGEDGKRWRPTFDWLVKDDTSALKVLEGNFEKKPRGWCDFSNYSNIEDDPSTEESETAESQESVET